MNLHEYQAKQLFKQYALPVSEGVVCKTADEAEMALFQLNGDVWIAKCQVHAGGRGKAGGVQLVHNAEEARAFADKWLGQHLVTFQTDKKGQPVNSIYIEETCQIEKELYLGAVIDRASQKVVFMASSAGGMSIEDVARETPELIHKVTIEPLVGGMPYQGHELAFKLGLSGEQNKQFAEIFVKLAQLFIEKDFSLVEVNPLVVTKEGNLISPQAFNAVNAVQRYAAINPLESLSKEKKIELLHLVDRTARAEDPRVTRVSAALSSIYEEVLVVATDGTLAADIRPLVRLSISVLVEEDGKRERGSCGSGGRFGLDWFFEVVNGDIRAVNFAKEAVRQALVNLSAVAAPAGLMPVVLGAGWPGVLLHEAVGHGLEGDFNRKESSLFISKSK